MKRSTAIRHLVEMAEVATEHTNLAHPSVDWPLSEMWVAGHLLERTEEVDHASVVLMIDLPPDELPWLAVHPTAEWVGEQLRLGKRPMLWSYRPAAWPAWTYRNPGRPVLVSVERPGEWPHRPSAIRSGSRSDRA